MVNDEGVVEEQLHAADVLQVGEDPPQVGQSGDLVEQDVPGDLLQLGEGHAPEVVLGGLVEEHDGEAADDHVAGAQLLEPVEVDAHVGAVADELGGRGAAPAPRDGPPAEEPSSPLRTHHVSRPSAGITRVSCAERPPRN